MSFAWSRHVYSFVLLVSILEGAFGCSSHDIINKKVYIPSETNPVFENRNISRKELELIFNNINIIRNIGSVGHAKVKEFIVSYLRKLNWSVEIVSFQDDTPLGQYEFSNIIGYSDISVKKYLTLACHYDSLLLSGFLGSTDSAMPCAVILKVADSITQFMQLMNPRLDVGLQLIFFDGEEALLQWSSTDGIYGSRHLAAKWASESKLHQIELFILLDLIGGAAPRIPDFHHESNGYYEKLVILERQLRASKFLLASGPGGATYFGHYSSGSIQDDHIPFVKRGVPVLHVIPLPFPTQWHTLNDNADHLDWDTSLDFLILIETFVRSYLNINF